METGKLMEKQGRFDVLLRLAEDQRHIDVLNRDAVDKYTEVTGAPFKLMSYGANQCRLMGRDMSEMAAEGLLERHRTGIVNGYWGMPRWVWCYKLTDLGRDRLNEVLPGRQPIAA